MNRLPGFLSARTLLFLVIWLVLVGCTTGAPAVGPTDTSSSAPSEGDVQTEEEAPAEAIATGGDISMGMTSGWDSLDPHNWNNFFFGTMVMSNIYDPLLTRNPDTREIGPGLAERFEVSEDGTDITLYLQQGVKFHDGTDVTAASLDYSFSRIFDETTLPVVRSGLAAAVDSWEVLDDYTFLIHLKQPSANFLDSLTWPQLSVVCPGAVEEYGEDFGQHPCGTGPFKLREWVVDDHLTLERNPDYNWAPAHYGRQGPAYIDSVTYRIIPEVASRQAAFEVGEIDILMYPQNREVSRLLADEAFAGYNLPRTGFPRVITMPTDRWPFDDVLVRQAIAWGIDREEILQVVFEGVGKATSSFLAPGTPCYWDGVEADGIGYSFDLERAQSLLAEAGWTPDSDGVLVKDGRRFEVTMGGLNTAPFTTLHQVVQSQFAKLGIAVEIVQLDQAAWLPAGREATYNFSDNQLGPASDPNVLFSTLHSSQAGVGSNWAYYNNPEVDELLLESASAMDPAARCAIFNELQTILIEEVPYVPFYAQEEYFMTNANLQGLVFDPKSLPLFYDVYLAD